MTAAQVPEPTLGQVADAQDIFEMVLLQTSQRKAQLVIARAIAAAVAAERANHTSLIRRKDAALTAKQAVIDAVAELPDVFEQISADEDRFSHERTEEKNHHAAMVCSGMAAGWGHAARRLRAALASPDTTQEVDRG